MNDRPTNAATAMIVPITMYGVRLPKRDLHLSDSAPKIGSMNSASTLSSAITTPDQPCAMPNLSVRILGMILSYACQNAQMRKKAKPTQIVRL